MVPRIGLTASPAVLDGRAVESLERAYVGAVARAGGLPFVLPVLDPSLAEQVVAGLDGVLLAGGGDVHPSRYGCLPSPHLGTVDEERDDWELAVVRAAAARRLPVLGICRGAQVLNVAMGGTLLQHLPEVSDLGHCKRDDAASLVHTVRVDAASRLRAVLGADVVGVNSLHHQAVREVGTGLAAVAWAEDGTVEAVEGAGANRMIGVQWHPELLENEAHHAALFDWLSAQARQQAGCAALTTPAA